MICAREPAFSKQGGMALCFFLVGRSVGDQLEWFLGKGRAWAPWAQTSPIPPTLTSLVSFGLRGAVPIELASPP